MNNAIQPGVVDFRGKENSAGTQNAKRFGEHAVLQFAGLEMVQHENADGGAERLIGKGQVRGVALERGETDQWNVGNSGGARNWRRTQAQ